MQRNVVFISALGLPLLVAAGCDTGPTGVVPQPTTCETASPIQLAAGQSVELTGGAASLLCVEATSLGQEFVLVTTSLLSQPDTTRLLVESENVVSPLGPPSPTPPAAMASSSLDLGVHLSADFDAGLRERERALVIHPGAGTSMGVGPAAIAARAVPAPGDLVTLNAQAGSACEDPLPTAAKVEAVSQKAIVVADLDNPDGGFTPAEYEQFAETYDTFVTPVLEEHFGTPSDIDGNGRVILFFTKEVNALSSEEDGSFTYGFFYSRDLFPVESHDPAFQSCAGSNQGEIVYLLVPDPSGTVGIAFDHAEVQRLVVSGIAHEVQHLINAGDHLFGPGGPRPFEETWLNEGLSHAAEELLFYEAANLTPRLDIGIDDLNQQGIDAINEYQLFNYLRLREFFLDPSENSPYNTDDALPTRGAAWSLLRYAADRLPGDDAIFFRELVESQQRGFANLASAVGGSATLLDWVGDWSVGLYADNRVPGIPQKYFDQSWDNPSLYSGANFDPPYIQTTNLALNPSLSQWLIGGSSAFLRFAVSSGQTSTIRISSGGNAPPSTLRATLLRTR